MGQRASACGFGDLGKLRPNPNDDSAGLLVEGTKPRPEDCLVRAASVPLTRVDGAVLHGQHRGGAASIVKSPVRLSLFGAATSPRPVETARVDDVDCGPAMTPGPVAMRVDAVQHNGWDVRSLM